MKPRFTNKEWFRISDFANVFWTSWVTIDHLLDSGYVSLLKRINHSRNMQPAFFTEFYGGFDADASDSEPDVAVAEDLQVELKTSVENLKATIFMFKKKLYKDIVELDKKHDAGDMGAMMTFQSIFLHCVSYWVGTLDSSPTPKPQLPRSMTADFDAISNVIQTLKSMGYDGRTLVYSILFEFSTQHPFNLGPQENDD